MDSLATYYTQVLFIALIVMNHLFELYLNRRQVNTLSKARSAVPPEFSSHLPLEDHQKAIAYGSARLNLGAAHLLFDAILLFYWFPFRGAEKLFLALPTSGMHKDVLFLLAFTGISMLLRLPWAIYSTFVLEERFGFNRSTPLIFLTDRLKGLALGLALGVPLLYLVLFVFERAGDLWWLLSFGLFMAFQFGLLWIYPVWIAPLFNKFRPLEDEAARKSIEDLVTRAGFKSKGVYVMDASRRSSHGNAYFTGFGKNKRIVFFDTLLKELELREVEAVLAHELGHLKFKHVLLNLCWASVALFVSFFLMGQLAKEAWFFQGHFIRTMSPGILLFLFAQALPLYTFWTTPLGSWVSRKFEFQADRYAATESSARNMISALLKLYQQNASPVVTDKIYSGFYHSHPPALERIRHLESLEGKSGERLP